jgi:drug/metabolite transporter (DMT)-like permease
VLGVLAAPALREAHWPGSVRSTVALALYAAPFSFAYVRLGAGLGALILFGAVQITMLSWGFVHGERASKATWLGFVTAVAGLLGLCVPGASAPDILGTAMMTIAGVAWGVYSLRGRTSTAAPLATTAANFLGTVPLAGVLIVLASSSNAMHVSGSGLLLALSSGALASGVGYSLWYSALRHLTATRAAILQLLVPVLTAAAAVVLLDESISLRLLIGGSAILGGVAITLRARS